MPLSRTVRRREAEAAAATERLRLPDRDDLGAETGERVDEDRLLSGPAGDDHARHAGADEPRDRVLGERIAGDRDERLRLSLRRLAEPLRLAAREEERLHQALRLRDVIRPADALVLEAGRPRLHRIEQVAPVDDQRARHGVAHLGRRDRRAAPATR